MRAILTPDDLKKGDLVEPGWYPLEITDYKEEPASKEAKNAGSTNSIFNMKIFDGPNKGVSPQYLLNEAGLSYGKGFYSAVKLPKTKEGGYEVSTEIFRSLIGKKVKGYISRGRNKDTGNEFNKLSDFQPID